jgi:hypothetical protein
MECMTEPLATIGETGRDMVKLTNDVSISRCGKVQPSVPGHLHPARSGCTILGVGGPPWEAIAEIDTVAVVNTATAALVP